MSKSRLYMLSPFREKYDFSLHYLCYFWQETGWGVKSNDQDQNLTYPISPTRFGQLPLKNFGSSTFQFCGNRLERTFQKLFNMNFQVWLLLLVRCLHFWKKINFAEFNAKSIGINFKSQNLKTRRLVCSFLIALLHFETYLIKVFPFFRAILDSWEISSKLVWSRKISWFRQKIFSLLSSFQGCLTSIHVQNVDQKLV